MSKENSNREIYNKEVQRITGVYNSVSQHKGVPISVSIEDIIGATPQRVSKKKLELLSTVTENRLMSYIDYYDETDSKRKSYDKWRTYIDNPADDYVSPNEANPPVSMNILEQIEDHLRNLPIPIYTYERGEGGGRIVHSSEELKDEIVGMMYDNYNTHEDEYLRYLQDNADIILKAIDDLRSDRLYEEQYIDITGTLFYYIGYDTTPNERVQYSINIINDIYEAAFGNNENKNI